MTKRSSRPPVHTRPIGKLKGWKTLIEVCTDQDPNLGNVAKEYEGVEVIRITEVIDWSDRDTVEQIIGYAMEHPGVAAHGSIPCSPWPTWQEMNLHKFGEDFVKQLKEKRAKSLRMLKSFIWLAETILANGGDISFE